MFCLEPTAARVLTVVSNGKLTTPRVPSITVAGESISGEVVTASPVSAAPLSSTKAVESEVRTISKAPVTTVPLYTATTDCNIAEPPFTATALGISVTKKSKSPAVPAPPFETSGEIATSIKSIFI